MKKDTIYGIFIFLLSASMACKSKQGLSDGTKPGKDEPMSAETAAMMKKVMETQLPYTWFAASGQGKIDWDGPVSYTHLDVYKRQAQDVDAKAIIGMTTSGFTAFKISSYRPIHSKIYVFSEQNDILNTLNLVWGVQTFFYDKFTTTDETIYDCVNILLAAGKVAQGDIVINTGSMPMHKKYRTNMLKLTLVD